MSAHKPKMLRIAVSLPGTCLSAQRFEDSRGVSRPRSLGCHSEAALDSRGVADLEGVLEAAFHLPYGLNHAEIVLCYRGRIVVAVEHGRWCQGALDNRGNDALMSLVLDCRNPRWRI
jgi:hypothetical protein